LSPKLPKSSETRLVRVWGRAETKHQHAKNPASWLAATCQPLRRVGINLKRRIPVLRGVRIQHS
jgi:hypothetical protein